MAKRKRRKRSSEKIKKTLQYELAGITIIALCLIAIIKLGPVGRGTSNIYYFFLGEWYMAGLLGTIILAGYFIVKRTWPKILKSRLVGIYLILASMLLLAHVKLFGLMTEKSMLSNSSVIEGTYSLFKQITSGNASTADLGGGMIGAVLFSLFHLLFDSAGTKIISFFLILIGMILITGKSLGDVFEKMGKKIGSFIKAQWGVFLQDIKDWKEERREKVREKEKIDKKLLITKNNTKDIEVIVDEPISAETEVVSEPIISSFTERAYPVDENRANPKEVETEENTVEPDEAVSTMAITEVENKDINYHHYSY